MPCSLASASSFLSLLSSLSFAFFISSIFFASLSSFFASSKIFLTFAASFLASSLSAALSISFSTSSTFSLASSACIASLWRSSASFFACEGINMHIIKRQRNKQEAIYLFQGYIRGSLNFLSKRFISLIVSSLSIPAKPSSDPWHPILVTSLSLSPALSAYLAASYMLVRLTATYIKETTKPASTSSHPYKAAL